MADVRWFTAADLESISKILRGIFNPLDAPLAAVPELMWTFAAVGLFLAAMTVNAPG